METELKVEEVKGDPCQKEACAIQACLQKNNYQESRCKQFIQALNDCCAKLGTRQSTVCSGINVNKTQEVSEITESTKPTKRKEDSRPPRSMDV